MRLLWLQARKWSGLYSYSCGARTGHGWCELFTVWSLQHFCKEYSAIVCGHAVITCHSLLIDTWFTVHKPTLPLTFHKIIIINAHIPLVRFVAQHVLQQIYNKFGKWSLTLNRWQQYIFHVTVLMEKENELKLDRRNVCRKLGMIVWRRILKDLDCPKKTQSLEQMDRKNQRATVWAASIRDDH